jgi:hypothetical protein
VTDGQRSWECDREGHVETGEARPRLRGNLGIIDVDRHFSHAQIHEFVHDLTLEELGPTSTAGYECVRVRAVPKSAHGLWAHWLPKEADAYEMDFECDRSVLLNIVALLHDRPFKRFEVIEAVFDETLDPTLFQYEPEPGDQVEPRVPISERLSFEAALASMPFTVLVPTLAPEHSELEAVYHPPRRNGGWSYLSLIYRGSRPHCRLWVNQGPPPGPGWEDEFEWERVGDPGNLQKDLRISDPGEIPEATRILEFEQEGTYVSIRSDMERARLIALAKSFVATRAQD